MFIISEDFGVRSCLGVSCSQRTHFPLGRVKAEGEEGTSTYMNPPLQHPRGNSDKTHQDGKAHESDKKKVLKLFNSEKHFPFWNKAFQTWL